MTTPVFLAPGPEPIGSPIGVEQGAVYVITGPDGTRAVINDPDDRDFVGYLTEPPSGLERAAVRENAEELPEADGGAHGAFWYGRLPFTLTGIIQPELGASPLRQAKLLRATNAMREDARLEWRPSSAPPVLVLFRQQAPTRISGRRPKTFLVAGVSEEAALVSQAVHTVSADGAAALPADLEAVNAGTIETWPLLTVTGPIVDPVITNLTTGEALVLDDDGGLTLAAGESLVIDTNPRRRRIEVDGVNVYGRLNFPASRWPRIAPGTNVFRLGADSGNAAGTALVAQWRDAWG